MSEMIIVWEFIIDPAARAAFEHAYGPDGDWAHLFRRSPDYLGTQLLYDSKNPNRYLTLDRWRSPEAFAAFKSSHHADYTALDHRFESLTLSETHLGNFEST